MVCWKDQQFTLDSMLINLQCTMHIPRPELDDLLLPRRHADARCVGNVALLKHGSIRSKRHSTLFLQTFLCRNTHAPPSGPTRRPPPLLPRRNVSLCTVTNAETFLAHMDAPDCVVAEAAAATRSTSGPRVAAAQQSCYRGGSFLQVPSQIRGPQASHHSG